MNRRPLLRAYIWLFAVVMVLGILAFAQSCPEFANGYLSQGCGHEVLATSGSGLLYYWIGISGVVTVAGIATCLLLRRRPTPWSVTAWCSAGLLGLVLTSSWHIEPRFLEIPFQVSVGVAALVAIPTGVSLARMREPAQSPQTGASTTSAT